MNLAKFRQNAFKVMFLLATANATAQTPRLNQDNPIKNTDRVWRINAHQGTQILNLKESKNHQTLLNYDISECSFCEGKEDNCDKDGVFSFKTFKNLSYLGLVCHVGAHSQRLMIFDSQQVSDKPIFTQTGVYFVDYKLLEHGLEIRFDTWGEQSSSEPTITSFHWPIKSKD